MVDADSCTAASVTVTAGPSDPGTVVVTAGPGEPETVVVTACAESVEMTSVSKRGQGRVLQRVELEITATYQSRQAR